MKKICLVILMCCVIFSSCSSKEPNTENVSTSEYDMNELGKEIASEIYDTSGQNNIEFGGGIVENSEYIFYTSENALVQIKKDTMEKSIIQQWEKESGISLYCTESELYYIQDMREVYSISLEDGKQQLLWTYEMLEKAGYTFPEIWGMAVYSGHIYLELCGFDIVQCEFDGHIGDKIAQDARSGAFWENAFFYRKRSSNEIYRFDIKTMKESVIREKKYEERVQYNNIFTIGNGLYYSFDGAIYLYDDSGKDVKIIEDPGFHVEGKDAIYYIKEEGNVEYLYKFNVQTKQISSLKLQEKITDLNYMTEARVICDMFFYPKDKNQYESLSLRFAESASIQDKEIPNVVDSGASDSITNTGASVFIAEKAENIDTDFLGAICVERALNHWIGNLVANEKYIFYTTKNKIIRLDRDTKELKTLLNFDREADLYMYVDKMYLYYIENETTVYKMDFDGCNREKVVSKDMLEQAGYKIPNIWEIKIYKGELYIHTKIYNYLIRYKPENGKTELIATGVYSGDFCDNSFYYVDEAKRHMYRVDLDTKKEKIIRKDADKGVEGFIYSDILCVKEKLYYVRRDKRQIYCYSKDGKDKVVGEGMKYCSLIAGIDDILYYSCYKEETYDANLPIYLGSYDGRENSILLLLPDDFYEAAIIVGNTLYYATSNSENSDDTDNYYKKCSW